MGIWNCYVNEGTKEDAYKILAHNLMSFEAEDWREENISKFITERHEMSKFR